MSISKRQRDNVLSKAGLVVKGDRLNAAGRYAESYLRLKLYRFEDRAALALYRLLEQTNKRIQDYALYTAGNLGLREVGNDAKSIAFRRILANYVTQQLTEYAKQAALTGYQFAYTAYAAGWYGRLWMLQEATHGDKRVHVSPVPKSKAATAVLQPGITEAVNADMASYDYLGGEWQDTFFQAAVTAINKVKRVLTATASEPTAVLALTQDIGQTLGINATPKQQAKGLYHATQLPVRTAIMRSANHASADVYKSHTELLLGAMWVTSHDERVCPVCNGLDGHIYIVNSLVGIALFGLPPDGSHYGCRCTVIPLLIPVDHADAPPVDDFDDWLDDWGYADDLEFFMADDELESTQI